jgi:hypothetical protein
MKEAREPATKQVVGQRGQKRKKKNESKCAGETTSDILISFRGQDINFNGWTSARAVGGTHGTKRKPWSKGKHA